MTSPTEKLGVPGIGVDAQGGGVIDPTKNVLDLVNAAVTRLDDLRRADLTLINALRDSEIRRIDEVADLRSHYTEMLATAEGKRIDAIRSVDVAAVAVASDRATDQASILASQVTASADALRALVASTAEANARAQATLTQQFNDRIASLEKASYEGKGRQAYTDPAMVELVAEMRRLTAAQSQVVGQREEDTSHRAVSTSVVAVAGLVIGSLIGLGGLIVAFLDKSNSGAQSFPVSSSAQMPATPAPPTIVVMPFQSLPPATVTPSK